MRIKALAIRTVAILVALGGTWMAFTQQRKNQAGQTEESLRIEKIQDDLHVIFGPGGNIGVYITNEGVILVDDKFERHAERIVAQVEKVTDQPIRYILNTHHHGDHTGSNQKLSASADIVMHENARKNLVEQSQPGLPRMTFNDSASIFLGGKEVRAHHFSRGHTDGDAVIEFVGTGVIHMGDMFVEGGPFIDYSSGASAVEWDKTLAGALSLSFDRVIRGHGPVGTRSDLELWRKQFSTVRDRVRQLTRTTSGAQEAAKQLKLEDLPGWGLDGRLGRGIEGLYKEMSD